jgi:hypothetical protein
MGRFYQFPILSSQPPIKLRVNSSWDPEKTKTEKSHRMYFSDFPLGKFFREKI